MHPYRSAAKPLERERATDDHRSDGTLAWTLAITWLLSVARVVLAVMHHETFAFEATIAVLLAAILPWAIYEERAYSCSCR